MFCGLVISDIVKVRERDDSTSKVIQYLLRSVGAKIKMESLGSTRTKRLSRTSIKRGQTSSHWPSCVCCHGRWKMSVLQSKWYITPSLLHCHTITTVTPSLLSHHHYCHTITTGHTYLSHHHYYHTITSHTITTITPSYCHTINCHTITTVTSLARQTKRVRLNINSCVKLRR